MADARAEYLRHAQALKDADPRMAATDIHRTLEAAGMSRPEGWRLETKGKGKLGWKSIEARKSSKVRERAQRKAALRPIPDAEFQEFGRRNNYSQQEIKDAIRHERATKRQQRAIVKASGGALEVGHYTPQAYTKSPQNRARFEQLNPGDASSNRFSEPAAENRAKGSKWYPTIQQRQQAGMAVTRSGAIQAAFRATSPTIEYARQNALRLARDTAPMWASIPLGAATLGQSAHAAIQKPTADNIETAAWDAANVLADAASFVPIPIVSGAAEGAQKLLGLAQAARQGQKWVSKQQQTPKPSQARRSK